MIYYLFIIQGIKGEIGPPGSPGGKGIDGPQGPPGSILQFNFSTNEFVNEFGDRVEVSTLSLISNTFVTLHGKTYSNDFPLNG